MGSKLETPPVYEVSCDRAACTITASSPTPRVEGWSVVSKGQFPRGKQAMLCPEHTEEYTAFWKADD